VLVLVLELRVRVRVRVIVRDSQGTKRQGTKRLGYVWEPPTMRLIYNRSMGQKCIFG